MTPEELEAAIQAGDAQRCLDLLETATEAERRAAAPVAIAYRTGTGGREYLEPVSWTDWNETTGIALLGTASLGELKSLGHFSTASVPGRSYEILRARRPEWLGAWAAWILGEAPHAWGTVRRLQREGLCTVPEDERYVIGMIYGWWTWGSIRNLVLDDPEVRERHLWSLFRVEGNAEHSLMAHDAGVLDPERRWDQALARLAAEGEISRDRLLDAGLDALERDFYPYRARWFPRFHEALSPTLEERAERLDRYLKLLSSRLPSTVSFALKALAALDKAGRLPGERFVSGVLPALRAREKGTMTLALRLLDRAARGDPSLRGRATVAAVEALSHEAPNIQAAAVDLIERHAVPADPDLESLLHARLEDIAPSQRPRLLALLQSSPEVPTPTQPNPPTPFPGREGGACIQYSVMNTGTPLLSGEGFPNARMGERLNALPGDLRELAGVDAALQAVQQGTLDLPALDLRDLRIPRLDPTTALTPVTDLDELIDLFSTVLENEEPPEDVERVLDGVSRLCAERPPDFERRTAPLLKRAKILFKRGWGPVFAGALGRDLCAVALAWITGEVVPATGKRRALESFLGSRTRAVAERAAARQAAPLLAAPTHRGGWIDPRVLVARVGDLQAARREPHRLDVVQALLRAAPDYRAEALAAAGDLRDEIGDAVRYALGAAREELEIGPTAGLWVAAARARAPWADDPAVEARHPGLGPDAGQVARVQFTWERRIYSHQNGWQQIYYKPVIDLHPPVAEDVSWDLPTVLHHRGIGGEPPARRWCATVWPVSREGWCATGALNIGDNIDWWQADWGNRVFLEPLLDPDTHLGPVAGVLLGLSLATKQPMEVSLATDVLIAAVDDGRLNGPGFAEAMRLIRAEGLMPGRWARPLAEAARVSPLHAETVRAGIAGSLCLPVEGTHPGKPPAGLADLLALLHELCVQTGAAITSPEANAYLGGLQGAGKAAKLAKTLLALEGRDDPQFRRAAAERTLAGRIERAERWLRMGKWGNGEMGK
jgi:uncharacterized protein DUF6493